MRRTHVYLSMGTTHSQPHPSLFTSIQAWQQVLQVQHVKNKKEWATSFHRKQSGVQRCTCSKSSLMTVWSLAFGFHVNHKVGDSIPSTPLKSYVEAKASLSPFSLKSQRVPPIKLASDCFFLWCPNPGYLEASAGSYLFILHTGTWYCKGVSWRMGCLPHGWAIFLIFTSLFPGMQVGRGSAHECFGRDLINQEIQPYAVGWSTAGSAELSRFGVPALL